MSLLNFRLDKGESLVEIYLSMVFMFFFIFTLGIRGGFGGVVVITWTGVGVITFVELVSVARHSESPSGTIMVMPSSLLLDRIVVTT